MNYTMKEYEKMDCAYKPGNTHIEAFIIDGKAQYSEDPESKFIADGCEIINFNDAVDRIQTEMANTYNKPWVEITKEEYWNMLEALPPEKYEHSSGSFRMCEYLEGDYTAHFIPAGDKYYTATRQARSNWKTYREELQTQLESIAYGKAREYQDAAAAEEFAAQRTKTSPARIQP